jgi:hypothetical protein
VPSSSTLARSTSSPGDGGLGEACCFVDTIPYYLSTCEMQHIKPWGWRLRWVLLLC